MNYEKEVLKFRAEMQRYKNQVIDQMNRDKESFVVLRPGEEWAPQVTAEPVKCLVHDWHKVTLLTSVVEECKKCGKLRGE
jgi:hypothetical protein